MFFQCVVHRLAGNANVDYVEVPQDVILAGNQAEYIQAAGGFEKFAEWGLV